MMLRAPELTDVDALYLWENDKNRLEQGRTGLPLSRKVIWDYVNNYNQIALSSTDVRLMFDHEEFSPAGVVDLYDIELSASRSFVSIYVAQRCRKQGLGTLALEEVEKFARDHLGLQQLCAVVSSANLPSLALFTKAGYVELTKLPQWVRDASGELVSAILFLKKLSIPSNT